MLATPHRESAQIIAFPTGGRRSFIRQTQPLKEAQASQIICAEALDTCWYHSEAIRASVPSATDIRPQ